ncbi:hypothetical protein B566_EDAN008696 [Ephemera danica]|nr:hypothetical protein B566_EDAN008696 [Ephemera danica]
MHIVLNMSFSAKPMYCALFVRRLLSTKKVRALAPISSSSLVERSFGTSGVSFNVNKHARNQRPDWNKAVSEAEKIVGYPTSFLSLRWLLSDEIANIALHLRKLVGSNHPLLKTAKSLLNNGRSSMQAWGLIVLLVSKAAGHQIVDEIELDKAAGVLHSQRALAEVTEMIRTSHLVHKGLVNLYPDMYPDARTMQDMTFGNKIALLSGDYLLGNSCAELAALRNSELVELMSSAVRDLAEAEFIGERDKQNQPLPSRGLNEQDWLVRSVLSAGSLLGKSCQGALKLAGHNETLQQSGYRFGQHLALAWQACLELEPFISSAGAAGQMPFSLTSAPVIFTLQNQPELFEEIDKGRESIDNVDYAKVHATIMQGPGITQTKELQRFHAQKALLELEVFAEESDACKALSNIIFAMGD